MENVGISNGNSRVLYGWREWIGVVVKHRHATRLQTARNSGRLHRRWRRPKNRQAVQCAMKPVPIPVVCCIHATHRQCMSPPALIVRKTLYRCPRHRKFQVKHDHNRKRRTRHPHHTSSYVPPDVFLPHTCARMASWPFLTRSAPRRIRLRRLCLCSLFSFEYNIPHIQPIKAVRRGIVVTTI